jgi:integrase
MLATLAGAGLRIEEALTLERRHLNLAKGTLAVIAAGGARALARPLAVHGTDRPRLPDPEGPEGQPADVRRRLLLAAVERANVKLVRLGIEPIADNIGLHGLRRTYASLRAAAGDDVAYTAEQLGHTDPAFSLRVYTHAVKRRQRLAGAELQQFSRANEWAEWARTGTNGAGEVATALPVSSFAQTKTPR